MGTGMDAQAGFAAAAQGWHEFYLLVGGAAATLCGLMFIAVTFGATLVSKETATAARAFIDPPFSHFVQVLFTAAGFVMPSLGPHVIGYGVIAASGLRLLSLVWVFGQVRRAHRVNQDIELSDWLMAVWLPGVALGLMLLAGAGLVRPSPGGYGTPLLELGLAVAGLLAIGIRSAWELMIWLATIMPGPEGSDARKE